jgi:hypothetical protein
MAFCPNCGIQIEGNPNFCASCGTKQTRQPTNAKQVDTKQTIITSSKVSDWNMLSNPKIILGLIFIEAIAIIGAMPLFPLTVSFSRFSYSLWQGYYVATVIFGVIGVAGILKVTWHKPVLTRVTSVLLVSGLVAFTIFSIQQSKIFYSY